MPGDHLTPSEVTALLHQALVAIEPGDVVSDMDRFMSVHEDGIGGLEAVDRDRVYALAPAEGPFQLGQVRCMDEIRYSLGIRYLDRKDSQARMLDDQPKVRAGLRAATALSPYLKRVTVESGPRYTYLAIDGSVVVEWTVKAEYHA